MSERWTAEDRKALTLSPIGWIIVVALGVLAFALLGYTAWQITSKASDVASIVGEWEAADPPWRAVFRPNKTFGMTFNGTSAPASLAPVAMTPGVEVPGHYSKGTGGTYQLKLQNGKNYEVTFNKYVADRFDLTDADGASAVITFQKVKSAEPEPAKPAAE